MSFHSRVAVAFVVAALVTRASVVAQTLTVYGTAPGQSGPAYPGGTIAAGDTVRIDDGGSVTGAVSSSGTLQFNQTSGALTLTYAGDATATLSHQRRHGRAAAVVADHDHRRRGECGGRPFDHRHLGVRVGRLG